MREHRAGLRSSARRALGATASRTRAAAGSRPLSQNWGLDRGQPLLRLYMERFLEEFASDIRGHCLEFQEDHYVRRYGRDAVTGIDVLHLDDSNPAATIVGDLTEPNDLPGERFDCIVCTFVLHTVFDLHRAVSELHRMLKPGGVLLVGVPHVSMAGPGEHELWRFTPEGLERLMRTVFGPEDVTLRAYGSSLTAAGQLRGLVAHEFTSAELEHHDPRFAVQVCARARRRAVASPPGESGQAVPAAAVLGWDEYARTWSPERVAGERADRVRHLGDEWTHEEPGPGITTYGLPPETLEDFGAYLSRHLLDPHLPSTGAVGLEIGPGGGRLTELLVSRTHELHLAEPSEAMMRHLRRRFAGLEHLRYHQTDSATLPKLRQASLDFVAALDVFVHLEPWEVFSYLRQATALLRPGGVGVIHYANALTAGGWEEFEAAVDGKLRGRPGPGAFGAMSPELMARFLEALEVEVVSVDTGTIPRDAVAVFRVPLGLDARHRR